MHQGPTRAAYPHANASRREQGEAPMSMLEAALFFGVLAIILDGFGLMIGRFTGADAPVLACLNPLLYIAAGFVGARYATVANGVWTGIMTATIDMIGGLMLTFLILPQYRDMFQESSTLGSRLPASFVMVGGGVLFVIIVVSTLISGSFFGVIGAAFSRLKPFRPQETYAEEY